MGVHSPARRPIRRPVRGRALLTTTVMVGLLSGLGALLTGPMAAASTGTYLRVAQLADVLPGDAVVVTPVANARAGLTLANLAYGSVSPYQRIDPGDYVVAVRRADDTQPPLVSAVVTASPGGAYTLLVGGDTGAARVTVLTDDLAAPPPGQGRLRVLDAEPDGSGTEIRGPGGQVVLAAGGGRAGDYRMVPAGTVELVATRPGEPATTLPVAVAADEVVTVVVLRGPSGLSTRVQVDAVGPAIVPPGAVDAGLGGTAGGGPDRGVRTMIFAGLAVLAAGLSLHLRRTRRTPG